MNPYQSPVPIEQDPPRWMRVLSVGPVVAAEAMDEQPVTIDPSSASLTVRQGKQPDCPFHNSLDYGDGGHDKTPCQSSSQHKEAPRILAEEGLAFSRLGTGWREYSYRPTHAWQSNYDSENQREPDHRRRALLVASSIRTAATTFIAHGMSSASPVKR